MKEVQTNKKDVEQKPETSSPSEEVGEDWETELLDSVDYDQVKENANKTEDWENEIDELLASCDVEKAT